MESCLPNNTYSMMDEYSDEMDKNHCYVRRRPAARSRRLSVRPPPQVNPFVGEGRYARYLRVWLSVVPKRQVLLLNFDEWTGRAAETMQAWHASLCSTGAPPLIPRTQFTGGLGVPPPASLRLPRRRGAQHPHSKVRRQHVPRRRRRLRSPRRARLRSVHVDLQGSTNASQIAAESVEGALSFATQCVLHEFFLPYAADLDVLFKEFDFPPMRWDTGRKGEMHCPSTYRYWHHLKGEPMSVSRATG